MMRYLILLLLLITLPLFGEDTTLLGADLQDDGIKSEPLKVKKKLKNSIAIKTTLMKQTDNGGIEEIEEDLTVFENVILYTREVNENHKVTANLLLDVVSSASMTREHNASYRALQSKASGTVMGSLTAGWQGKFDTLGLSLSAGASGEYAYNSLNGGFGITKSFDNENTIIGLTGKGFFDTVRMIRYDGREDADEGKQTYTASLELTQVLTPAALLNFNVSYTYQTGFLATQFNSVWINGVEDYELLPDERNRFAATLRYKQAIGRLGAFEIGGRYYRDDWGIQGETVNLEWLQYQAGKKAFLGLQYRFYIQSEADQYQPRFTVAERYRTSDPDLGDFYAHLVGVKGSIFDVDLLIDDVTWDFGLYMHQRSNGINSYWITIGFQTDY